MPKRGRLPSLQALAVFEAVGRQLSFSAAAEQLGTSQPAVSQRILALEEELQTPLFRRLHRGVALTPDGERLHRAVCDGFALIRDAVAQIDGRAVASLTVATDFGFAAWWLMPRLGAFRERFPDIEVRVLTSQDHLVACEATFDAAILFGAGDWAGCTASLLFSEVVAPVCAPSLLRGRVPDEIADLTHLPLLHLEAPCDGRWLSWADLLACHGLARGERGHDFTFNNYQLVLEAAVLGQGVALGWWPLIERFLREGQLVALPKLLTRTRCGYFLVEPKNVRQDIVRAQFGRWIVEQATETPSSAFQSTGVPPVSQTAL
jgi:LysR family glycine cleavage system transcriptional activator